MKNDVSRMRSGLHGSRSGAVDRRRLLKLGGGLGAATLGGRLLQGDVLGQDGTPAASPAAIPQYAINPDIEGDITFWHFWGSPIRRTAVQRIIAGFNQEFPNIRVTETAVPFSDIWTKNLAAVAAGEGMPNVIVEDRPTLPDRAANDIDISLGDLAARDGVTGESFWPFTWEEATVEGVPYGLPYETDIRVLYYNKAAFTEAGLDPNTPPTNWDELWTFADALDIRDGDNLERVGFFPAFGNIGLDQWTWNNGGQWQDADFNPTMNAPANVETLEWMKTWADRYGYSNIQALQSTFGSGNQDGFQTGKVAMIVDIQGYTSILNFFNAQFRIEEDGENLGYGVAPITPAPGHDPAALSGGFALSIPRGAEQTDASWEFMKYMVFVGQASWARDTYGMPTIQSMATDPVLAASPNWPFFVEAMDYGRAKEYNPFYPAFTGDLLPPATLAALSGEQTAQEALDAAQQAAEEEVERVRG